MKLLQIYEELLVLHFVGAIAIGAELFNEGLTTQVYTKVNCLGYETELMQCEKQIFKGIYCPTAGVICQGNEFIGKARK